MDVTYRPSFLLRKVIHTTVLAKYRDGKYSKLKISDIKITSSNLTLSGPIAPAVSENSNLTVHTIKTKSGAKLVIHTTSVFHSGVLCHWCRLPIDDNPTGIPVGLLKEGKDQTYVFTVDGLFCGFRCAYAMFLKESNAQPRFADPRYRSGTESRLSFMFDLLYPGKTLSPSLDWRLLGINGGTMTKEQYHDDPCRYIESPGIMVIPGKPTYIKLTSSVL